MTDAVIGQVTNSIAARRHADDIDKALGVETRRYDGPAVDGLPAAFAECDLVISHLALGATTRIIAPLLADKKTDPGVVVLDEAARFAVPLVGGHGGGANDLARRLSAIGATPVLTTATDSLGLPALDTLGWAWSGDVAGVTRSLIDGRPVQVVREHPWPLPPLPGFVGEDVDDPVGRIVVSDAVAAAEPDDLPTVRLAPKSLVAGMGCNRGTPASVLREHLERTFAEAGLTLASLVAITSADVKANELGLMELAHSLGVPFVTYPAEVLDAFDVPNPSAVVSAEVGTRSVAEASVMARGADLVVGKQKSPDATCAIGRLPARGKLAIVGLGPGARDLLSPRARDIIQGSSVVVGYAPYVRQIRDLVRPGTEVIATKMGTEEERTAKAIARAREGRQVAFVCGGDPAIYAMASPTLEMGTDGIDVEVVPGITAELAVSAILGAPLGHDHATISLSDLHTDWDTIVHRLRAAAEGDFVVTLYNPRSRTRTMQLPTALDIMREHRPPTTPVAMVEHAGRKRQAVRMSTLAEFDPEWVNMTTLVVIGSSTTKYVTTGGGDQLIVTPRDYQWMEHHG